MQPQEIIRHFENIADAGEGKWMGRCPGHNDSKNSLSISVGDDGRSLMHCHAGCATSDILRAVGLKAKDLFVSSNGSVGGKIKATKPKGKIVATYDYHDANGNLVYQAVRLDPKSFRQRRPDGNGWLWNMDGVDRVLYRLPEIIQSDTNTVIFAPEGEKDADVLRELGCTATCNVGGAGKWRDEFGEHLRGRHVVILPDNDDPGRKHGEDVANSLAGVASRVQVVELPDVKPKGDVSDWLDAGGTIAKLMDIVGSAAEWTPTKTAAKKKASGFEHGLIKEVADRIEKTDHFAQDEAGNVYRYNAGVYKSRGSEFIKRSVKRVLDELDLMRDWSTRLAESVVEFIRVDSPELWKEPADVANVANGLLRLSDRTLLPHTPKHLSATQLPVKYDPDATCPATDEFDSQVFPDDAVILSHEIAACLINPQLKIQKALLFIGEGGNGKSRKLNQYKAFIGSPSCAAVSLHDLEANRFAAARLFGKLANICPDLPSKHLSGTSRFKAITGGDEITAEFKFKTSFEFKCHAKLIFSANHPPRSDDASEAFFDRWLVVPFAGRFRGTAQEIPEAQLDAKLTAPEELSGLLNHALAVMDRLASSARFSEPGSIQQAHREFYAATDPFAVWLDQFTVDDPDAVASQELLRSSYGAECERRGMARMTKSAFGLAFSRLRPLTSRKQRTLNGRVQWCYVGIGLSEMGSTHFTDLTDLTDFPHRNYCSDSDDSGCQEVQGNLKKGNPVKSVKSVNDATSPEGDEDETQEYRF